MEGVERKEEHQHIVTLRKPREGAISPWREISMSVTAGTKSDRRTRKWPTGMIDTFDINSLWRWWKVKITQSCPTVCDHTDCSLPGSSVHGILQARILEWVGDPFSRVSSKPRDQTQVSWINKECFLLGLLNFLWLVPNKKRSTSRLYIVTLLI